MVYGVVYGMVWYGTSMLWYGMVPVCCGMIWCHTVPYQLLLCRLHAQMVAAFFTIWDYYTCFSVTNHFTYDSIKVHGMNIFKCKY